jgi:hypothetical protein
MQHWQDGTSANGIAIGQIRDACALASLKSQEQRHTVTTARALRTPGRLPVTQAKLHAIRAAVKAGVKPNTIARQFCVTPAVIKKDLEDL